MSGAFRVPEGWSAEAARLVWEDWQAAVMGLDPSDIMQGRDIAESSAHALAGIEGLRVVSYEYGDGFRWYAEWSADGFPDTRLRAWAAVGAPVLAPRKQ